MAGSPGDVAGSDAPPAPRDSLLCAGCSAPLPAADLDRATWRVRCASCGRVEDLSRLRPEAPASMGVPPGSPIRVREIPGGTELSWRWADARAGHRAVWPVVVLLSLIAAAVFLGVEERPHHNGPWLVLGVRGVMGIVLAIVVHRLLLGPVFTRVFVRMDAEGVHVGSGPFPMVRSVRVPAEKIAAVHRDVATHASLGDWHSLAVEGPDGHREILLGSMHVPGGRAEEEFLQARISTRFGVGLPHAAGRAPASDLASAFAAFTTRAAPEPMTTGSPGSCPSCAAPLPWDALDRRTGAMRCPSCGVSADAGALRASAAAAAAPPSMAPEGVRQESGPGGYHASWRGVTGSEAVPRGMIGAAAAFAWTLVLWGFPLPAGIFMSLFVGPFAVVMLAPVVLRRYLRVDAGFVVTGFRGMGRVWGTRIPRADVLRVEVRGRLPILVAVLRGGGSRILEREYLAPGKGTGLRYLARRINETLGVPPAGG